MKTRYILPMRVHLFREDMYGFDFPNPEDEETLGVPEGLVAVDGLMLRLREACGARSMQATALLVK